MNWDQQVARVRADFPRVTILELPAGGGWVELENLELPAGWSPRRSRIAIEVPPDFPQAKPNGFFVEPGLVAPSGFPPPPASGEPRHGKGWVQVCYQPQTWIAERENLWRYIKAMLRWFAEVN